jgi:uncharacterized membrane protein YphA (DoxX/SURF4 family)
MIAISSWIMILCGAAIVAGWQTRAGFLGLAILLGGWIVMYQIPQIHATPHNGSEWTVTLETIAMIGAAWQLAGLSAAAPKWPEAFNQFIDQHGRWGRLTFAMTLPGFGLLHFIYAQYVAQVVPAWIPGQLFWAYFTGLAHAAAGLALLSGVCARLAALCLGLMFSSWIAMIHIPRVVASPSSGAEWTSLLVSIALSGCAWTVFDALRAQDRSAIQLATT